MREAAGRILPGDGDFGAARRAWSHDIGPAWSLPKPANVTGIRM
jgi:hypothetical protein